MGLHLGRAILVVAPVLAAGCLEAGAQAVSGSFQQTLSVDEPLELDVSTGAGSIEVRRGPAGRVEVVGRIEVRPSLTRTTEAAEELARRFEAEPPIEMSGNRLRVGHLEDRDFQRNVSVSYEIEVPEETAVRSRTGSGNQTLSGVRGPVNVGAGSGTVTLSDVDGPVEARTGSGSVRAEGIAGAFEGHTGSGSVRLVQSGSGDVEVSTGSGRSELSGIDGALRVRAGSGSITVDGEPKGRWDLETGSGSMRVRVPQDTGFELNAQSGSGVIEIDHPVTVQGRLERGRLTGQVSGGGPLLRLRTGSGNIRIE